MLLWQTDPLAMSLTKVDEKKMPKDLVARVFKSIQGFMGDKSEPVATSDQNAIELMKLGHGNEHCRDEIYCQILKQLSVNPKTESTIKGFQLLGLICEAFAPSDALLPFVFHFIYYNNKPECPWAAYAKYCIETLWVRTVPWHLRVAVCAATAV
jgi:hypothetical protein